MNELKPQPAYGSPESVIARAMDWIGNNGRESTVTLLLYEAVKCIKKLTAPAPPAVQEAVPQPEREDFGNRRYEEGFAVGWTECAAAPALAPAAPQEAVPAGDTSEDLRSFFKLEMEIGQIGAELGFDPDGDFELEDILAAIRALKGTPAAAVPHAGDPVPVLAAALALLVAGGFVAQEKADEAIQIALHTPGAAVPAAFTAALDQP